MHKSSYRFAQWAHNLFPNSVLYAISRFQLIILFYNKSQKRASFRHVHQKSQNVICQIRHCSHLGRMTTKSKLFISPNKYALPANNDTCDNDITTPSTSSTNVLIQTYHSVQDIDPTDPPIYIKNIENYSAFNSVLQILPKLKILQILLHGSHQPFQGFPDFQESSQ